MFASRLATSQFWFMIRPDAAAPEPNPDNDVECFIIFRVMICFYFRIHVDFERRNRRQTRHQERSIPSKILVVKCWSNCENIVYNV